MNLFKEIHDFCIRNRISIATAESCTGGRIASEISSIAGASFFFKGGLIAYQNSVKIDVLGIPKATIEDRTEVSFEVVEQMAKRVRNKFLVDFAISTSGYAGPSGGTILNPIGTVYIGISHEKKTISKRFTFQGDRDNVISQSVITAARLSLKELKNLE